MTIVITTCTNRKRKPVSNELRMSALEQADLGVVAANWTARLRDAQERFPASEVYGGRGFQEAVAAADRLDARLMVVSAGLGLIDASTSVAPYACTILAGAADSVGARAVTGFDASAWWTALRTASPFSIALTDIAAQEDGLICAALSDAYIAMIAEELLVLPEDALQRLRLFTRAPVDRIALGLRPFLMPYDDRLDGPDSACRGTKSDFAGRALRHFAGAISYAGDVRPAAEHAGAISSALATWRFPIRPDRQRHDDATMLGLIREHWADERGSTSRLLRRFRDGLDVACEQGRFAELVRTVREEVA